MLNAASVARMVLTTETAIVEKPAEEEDHGHGHGHHHALSTEQRSTPGHIGRGVSLKTRERTLLYVFGPQIRT